MKTILASLALSALVLSPAWAERGDNHDGVGHGNGNEIHAAPTPLLGAGLPGFGMMLGYGAYWLGRRRRNVR